MTLIWFDGFEGGTNPGNYTSIIYTTESSGRRNGQYGAGAWIFPVGGGALTVGGAVKGGGFPENNFLFYGSGTEVVGTTTYTITQSLQLGRQPDGRFQVSCSRNTESQPIEVILRTTNDQFPDTHWIHIEFYGANSGADTSWSLQINDEPIDSGVFTFTSTPALYGADWVQVRVPQFSNISTDDIYISDGTFLGDIEEGVGLVSGSGALTEWTPVPGTLANYQCVDEAVANGTTDYVTAGEGTVLTDLYSYNPVSSYTGAGSVVLFDPTLSLVVQYGTSTATGSLFVCHVVTDGTTTLTYTSTRPSVWAGFETFEQILTTNPFTTATWVDGELDTLEFGPQQVN